MRQFQEIGNLLAQAKKIVITTHQKPDADALGSSLGLAAYLKKLNHEVTVISPTNYPEFLNWMHGQVDVLQFDEKNSKIRKQIEQKINEAEIAFFMDLSDPKRCDPIHELIFKTQAIRVVIDHHLGKKDFVNWEVWDTEAAATGELVYEMILAHGRKDLLDVATAECLYAAIMTDTGGFKHANTSSKIHRIVADLIDIGVEANRINRLIYDNNTVERMKLLGYCLKDKLVVLPEYRTAYFALEASELKSFEYQTGDSEGIVNYALAIKGIRLAVFMMEREKEVKLSFRSVGTFPANEIANKYFGGGGHRNAAGGSVEKTIPATIDLLLKVLPEYQDRLLDDSLYE